MKKKYQYVFILSILCVFLIGISFQSSDFVGKIKPSANENVELISESKFSTKWVFVNQTAGYNLTYTTDFSSESWSSDNSEEITISGMSDDAYVFAYVSGANFGTQTTLSVGKGEIVGLWYNIMSFVKYEIPDSYINEKYDNSKLILYKSDGPTGYPVRIYATSDFDESTITWDNKPALDTLLESWSSTGNGWKTFTLNDIYEYIGIYHDGGGNDAVKFHSKEGSNDPYFSHYLYRYKQFDNCFYIQSNQTETINMNSPDTLDLSLVEGDKIEVTFNTSSTNRIDLNLRNDGSEVDDYILSSQGNGDFTTRTKTFYISSNMTVDQFEFTSQFDEAENLYVENISVYHPYSETNNYYLAPYGQKLLDLGYPHDYSVDIYENNIFQESMNLSTTADLQTLIYERTDSEIVYLNYYDSNNEHLDFQDYITYVNYTLDDFRYTDQRLSSNILYVDENSEIDFEIYDSFDALVKGDYTQYEQTFIDITLPVYELKIKNERSNPVSYTLTNNDTAVDKSGNLFGDEILTHYVASNTYLFEYLEEGTSETKSFTFTITDHEYFVLNSSRICFLSYTDQQGNHLFFEDYKTYVNGTLLYENIFYEDIGDTVQINVTDRFDILIYSTTYTVQSSNNYIPITLDMYELKIKNMRDEFVNVEIESAPYPIWGERDGIVEEGHYWGTYSFTSEEVGTSGTDIGFVDSANLYDGSCSIISEWQNHKKVLRLQDDPTAGEDPYFVHSETQATYGIREFWIASSDVNEDFQFRFSDATHAYNFMVGLRGGNLQYWDGIWKTIQTASNDTWYHIKVQWYTDDTFDVYVNGTLEVDGHSMGNAQDASGINRFYIGGYGNSSAYGYLDAYGDPNNDPNYLIGDNYYYNYYLATEPFEDYNLYSNYGVYYGTYDFRDETVGTSGTSINGVDYVTTTANTYIVDEIGGHKKVINQSNVGSSDACRFDFTSQETGILEFWLYPTDVTDVTLLRINSVNEVMRMKIDSDKWYGYNDSSYIEIGGTPFDNTWYHIQFRWYADHTYDIFINGILEVDGFYFTTNDDVIRFRIDTYDTITYIDAIGYSWDTTSHDGLGYEEGDNINPYGIDVIDELEDGGWTIDQDVYTSITISGEFNSHKRFLNLTDNSEQGAIALQYDFSGQTSGSIEFWIYFENSEPFYFEVFDDKNTDKFMIKWDGTYIDAYDGSWVNDIQTYSTNEWIHYKIIFDCASTWSIEKNGGEDIDIGLGYLGSPTSIKGIALTTLNSITPELYIDALAFNWTSGYYVGDNYNDPDTNYYTRESSYEWETNVAPEWVDEFVLLKGFYNIWITTSEETISFSYRLFDHSYIIINRSQMCFISLADQRGNFLNFENYRVYVNGTQLYENVFYEEVGETVAIEIKDRFDVSLDNSTYVVEAGNNYIPITLTIHSLKVYNMQEMYNHVNITRDPNYYEVNNYWSEFLVPNELVEFRLHSGYYKINITNNEDSTYSSYAYTLNGDDVLIISSENTITNLIYNIANVNTTIGNLITNIEVNITAQNSAINNSIVNLIINLDSENSTLGNLLINLDTSIESLGDDIDVLWYMSENSFTFLNSSVETGFINIISNISAINSSLSTLIVGIDNSINIVNSTVNTILTEMRQGFIQVESTVNYTFASLNQSLTQLANNISSNQVLLENLIIQRANDIDTNLIQIQTLINLLNQSVANESLVIQTLLNIIGNNISENHVTINSIINEIGNNITENNVQLTNLIEVTGNNITANQFVIQTLIDYVSNNMTENHAELITNLNFINNNISANYVDIITRLLYVNNSINQMITDLQTQILFLNGTIYTAILNVSTSIDFNSDMILGNISLTYQQNDFLTNLTKKMVFADLLDWSDISFNNSAILDQVDVFEFINNYRNQSVEIELRYQDRIDSLLLTAQNSLEKYLPKQDVEYRLKSVETGEYLSNWTAITNKTIDFGFYETEKDYKPITDMVTNTIFFIVLVVGILCIAIAFVFVYKKMYEDSEKKRKKDMRHTPKPTTHQKSYFHS